MGSARLEYAIARMHWNVIMLLQKKVKMTPETLIFLSPKESVRLRDLK